ncbi:MAG: hypothetical protein V4501_04630 [Pseudomonadota bacterium]
MYQIDNITATNTFPTPAVTGPNPNGYFFTGDPALGIPATVADSDWLNAVQEELCNVVTTPGLTLSKTSQNQLLQAIELINQQSLGVYTTSSSSPNTYSATLSPSPISYVTGMAALVRFTNANTSSATINFNSLGAVTIIHNDGTNLNVGDIENGMIALVVYDGTNFQLINPNFNPANYLTITNYQNNTPGYVDDTGTVNTYVADLTPAVTSYVAGLRYSVKIANTNTSQTPTINVNGLGPINIISGTSGTTIWPGNLQAGVVHNFVYDGTNMELQNPYIDQDALQQFNFIYGGDFSINPFQRNTSTVNVANKQFIADRFRHVKSGTGVISAQQDGTTTPTVAQAGMLTTACLLTTVTTASASPGATDYWGIEYPMDGPTYGQMAQKPFMLSFWVMATVTGTYSISFNNFGRDRSYVASYTINTANTWKYVSIPVLAPPSSGTWSYGSDAGLYICWYLAAGSSQQTSNIGSWQTGQLFAATGQVNNMGTNGNVFRLALVQVETGLNATLFKARPSAEEIEILQSFFEKSWSFDSPVGTANITGCVGVIQPITIAAMFCGNQMTVTKRQSPTVTWYSTATGAAGFVRNTGTNTDIAVTTYNFVGIKSQGSPNLASSISAGTQIFAHWTAEAEVA